MASAERSRETSNSCRPELDIFKPIGLACHEQRESTAGIKQRSYLSSCTIWVKQMKLPLKVRKEPLVEAVFEMRFDASLPASNILPGVIFGELEGS